MEEFSDTASVCSHSSTTAQTDQTTKKKDTVDENLTEALEFLRKFPMPISSHNRVKGMKNENVDYYESFCARAYNETMKELSSKVEKIIIFSSKNEQDSVVGGKRYIKQELEYLIIERWVRIVMDAYIKEKREKFETAFGNRNIHSADNAWRDYFIVAKDHEHTIVRIVTNVRYIFLHDKIFVHTIKGENKNIPVLKSFFANPTVTNFEILVNHHWSHHMTERLIKRRRAADDIDAENIKDPVDLYDYQIEPRAAKRINHSEAEKRRIKDKTQCKCIGLPEGFAKCANVEEPLAYNLLDQEHRLPWAVFGDDSDENRWGMCGSCHRLKTSFIDKRIKEQKDNYEFIHNYKLNYYLPSELVQQILLQIKMETYESVNKTISSHEVACEA